MVSKDISYAYVVRGIEYVSIQYHAKSSVVYCRDVMRGLGIDLPPAYDELS